MKKDFSKTIQNISNISDIQDIQQIQDIPDIQDIPEKKTDRRFKKNPDLVPFSLRMDKHDKEKLETLAWKQRTTVTGLINEMIKEYISKYDA